MITVLLALALAQAPHCSPDAAALMKAAAEHAAALDLAGAAQRLQAAVTSGCADAVLPSAYLRGWIAARDAYRVGGSPESLQPVLQADAVLQKTGGAPGPSQIASLVLQAASAAAQSERESLALFIDQAVQLETARLSAGLSAAPIITAHEAAGELWLQVHRYEDARRAYERAAERLGPTRRITLGLARVAARLEDAPEACRQYRTLVAAWKVSGPDPQEIAEARRFLRDPSCTSGGR
jgi:tetratricopeptide (TPR) repeat protein